MAGYTRESVEAVKEAVDMVELVGGRTELRRVGARHTGLCPFHDERTPSFSVNPDLGLYHCFGCGASGDSIRFVQEAEGLDFRDAVELLGERYGVELKLEREDPRAEERRRRRTRLLQLLERTAAFYAKYLWDAPAGAEVRAYLEERGLGEQVLREFRVGYAPAAWDRIASAARKDGYAPDELVAAGLVQQRSRDGVLYDRFRDRVMFPLTDPRGAVLGFGARALREDQKAKYLNSPENELFHKSRLLFGIDRARAAAARAGRVVVVEGYTDVLALHQAGLPETVAIMGTSMTQEQLAELSRTATTVVVALDADASGQEAMLRAVPAARERGVELRVVALPEGSDPADLVTADGQEAFRALLEGSLSVPEFQVRRVLAGTDLSSPGARDGALEELRPIIAATPERSAMRDALVRQAANGLDVPPSYLVDGRRQSPTAASSRHSTAPAPRPVARARPADPSEEAERSFLAMCLAQPGTGRDYVARAGDTQITSPVLRRVREHLEEHFDDPLAELPRDDPELTAHVDRVLALAEEQPSSEPVLRLSFLQLELRRIERELRRAGEESRFDRQRELWGARERVRAEIGEVIGETV